MFSLASLQDGFYATEISNPSHTVHKYEHVHVPATRCLVGRSRNPLSAILARSFQPKYGLVYRGWGKFTIGINRAMNDDIDHVYRTFWTAGWGLLYTSSLTQ